MSKTEAKAEPAKDAKAPQAPATTNKREPDHAKPAEPESGIEAAAADDAAPAPARPETPFSPLLANQWKARESGVFFNTHEVVPNAGVPMEHLQRPDFWAHVAQKLKPGDTIIAFPRDGAWYAELVVFDAGQNWANVHIKLGGPRPSFAPRPGASDEFVIRRDPIEGIHVVRASTGAKLKGHFPNDADARRWIEEHQRVLRS